MARLGEVVRLLLRADQVFIAARELHALERWIAQATAAGPASRHLVRVLEELRPSRRRALEHAITEELPGVRTTQRAAALKRITADLGALVEKEAASVSAVVHRVRKGATLSLAEAGTLTLRELEDPAVRKALGASIMRSLESGGRDARAAAAVLRQELTEDELVAFVLGARRQGIRIPAAKIKGQVIEMVGRKQFATELERMRPALTSYMPGWELAFELRTVIGARAPTIVGTETRESVDLLGTLLSRRRWRVAIDGQERSVGLFVGLKEAQFKAASASRSAGKQLGTDDIRRLYGYLEHPGPDGAPQIFLSYERLEEELLRSGAGQATALPGAALRELSPSRSLVIAPPADELSRTAKRVRSVTANVERQPGFLDGGMLAERLMKDVPEDSKLAFFTRQWAKTGGNAFRPALGSYRGEIPTVSRSPLTTPQAGLVATILDPLVNAGR